MARFSIFRLLMPQAIQLLALVGKESRGLLPKDMVSR